LASLGAVDVSAGQVRVLLGRAGVDRRLAAGTASLVDGAPMWRPRRGQSVPLIGCELLRVAAATGHDPAARDGDVVLTVRDTGGGLLRLCMSGAEAPLVQDWIATATLTRLPTPRPTADLLGEGEVCWSRISTLIAERATAEGWGVTAGAIPAPVVPDRRWWRVAALRRVAAVSAVPGALSVLLLWTGLAVGTQDWFSTIGLGRNGVAGAVLVVLGALGIGRRVHRGVHHVRAVAGLRREPARAWRYVRFLDPSGAPGLMLFSRLGDPAPQVLVPLAPLGVLGDVLPLHGDVDVYGEVADGALLVPVIDGHTCWPIGTAEQVPAEVVRRFTNAAVPPPRAGADRAVRAGG
jgi:hypothetical protein